MLISCVNIRNEIYKKKTFRIHCSLCNIALGLTENNAIHVHAMVQSRFLH